MFALIPHIIRARDVTDLNEKALEVGTAIRYRVAAHQPGGAAPCAGERGSSGSGAAAGAAHRMRNAAPPDGPAGGAAAFVFDPASLTQAPGSTFAVNVLLNGAQNVYSVPLQVSYDPKILQVVNVSNGGLLSQDGQTVAIVHRDDDSTGTLQITATRPPGTAGVSGQGTVVTLTFMAKASGQSTLAISKGGARDPAMRALPVAGAVATVTVQ